MGREGRGWSVRGPEGRIRILETVSEHDDGVSPRDRWSVASGYLMDREVTMDPEVANCLTVIRDRSHFTSYCHEM